MDVLAGSIDVRDLLSTSDVDDSSPLSAPDLRLLIDRLNIRSQSIKSNVRSYILSHRDDFAGIFSLASAAASSSAALADSLDAAIRLLSDAPADREIRDIAREICGKRRELEEKREALGVVEVIRGVLEKLELAREMVAGGRLKEAAAGIKELKEGLGLGDEEKGEKEEEEPAVFGFLRKEWMDCFDEVILWVDHVL